MLANMYLKSLTDIQYVVHLSLSNNEALSCSTMVAMETYSSLFTHRSHNKVVTCSLTSMQLLIVLYVDRIITY